MPRTVKQNKPTRNLNLYYTYTITFRSSSLPYYWSGYRYRHLTGIQSIRRPRTELRSSPPNLNCISGSPYWRCNSNCYSPCCKFPLMTILLFCQNHRPSKLFRLKRPLPGLLCSYSMVVKGTTPCNNTNVIQYGIFEISRYSQIYPPPKKKKLPMRKPFAII